MSQMDTKDSVTGRPERTWRAGSGLFCGGQNGLSWCL